MYAKKGQKRTKNGLTLEIWAVIYSELSTPLSHIYGNEYRFLVMHNLLRLFPEKGFPIEALPVTRKNFEERRKFIKHPAY